MVTFGSLLLAAGLALMVYVGYEASIYREGLRLTQQEFEGLPFRLVLMLGVAAGVSLLGGLQSSGQLKPISVADDPPPIVLRPRELDFVTFDHRGPLLGLLRNRAAGKSS